MIIGAESSDFSDVVDKSPAYFGIFYWWSERFPAKQHSATIEKEGKEFVYQFSSTNGPGETVRFEKKTDLLKRMQSDNRRFNSGGKCTIEF